MYSKESLDILRQRIDLVEVLTPYLQFQRSGSSFKALCPFHEEKTPSFIVQRGDTHYHCFGCGAHGDAIAFLMTYGKMSFVQAIETLAERFQVSLEREKEGEFSKTPSRALLKNALREASQCYHYLLLHSEEARSALQYLYDRGLDLQFLQAFEIGFAPSSGTFLLEFLRSQGITDPIMEEAGLLSSKRRDFFVDRIMFPIRDPLGSVIGFSARKYKESTFGGKYINTKETPLFKKSRVLFGLSYSRQRIAKQGQAIIVEGQIDALQLIHHGFDYTVAGQGTAFCAEHAKELIQLGVQTVFLALDGDHAGQTAAVKIGHLFQQKGIEARVVSLPPGQDPDSLLKERGPAYFTELLAKSIGYLPFLFAHLSSTKDLHNPSQKNSVVEQIAEQIRSWEQPVMVHESLRQLAEIALIPESTIGVARLTPSTMRIRRVGPLSFQSIDPNQVLEADLLRWLLIPAENRQTLFFLAQANIRPEHLHFLPAQRIYTAYLAHESAPQDLLSFASHLSHEEDLAFFTQILERKVNSQRAEEGLKRTLREILTRNWMEAKEIICAKIQNHAGDDTLLASLVQEFDRLQKAPPKLEERNF